MRPTRPSPLKEDTLIRALASWLAGGLIAFGLLWTGVSLKLRAEQEALLNQTRSTIGTLAESQAQLMENLILQVDQVTLFLANLPEGKDRATELQRMFAQLPVYSPLNPLYVDKQGIVRAARTPKALGTNLSGSRAFLRQRESNSPELQINPPEQGVGYLKGKTVIRFTRAIRERDGSFGGMISIALQPDQLINVGAISLMSVGDVIGLKFLQGDWLGYQKKGELPPEVRASALPVLAPHELGPDNDITGKESFSHWVGMNNYPLVTVVAITRENALAPLQNTKVAYQLLLSMGAGMALVISLGGSWIQVRRNERKRFQEQVQSTFRLAVDGAREELYMLSQFNEPVHGQIDFRIEDCNAQATRVSGYTRGSILVTPLSQLLGERNFELTRLFLMSAMRDGFAETEVRLYRKGVQAKRWYHCRAVRAELGLAVTLRDIDDIKQKELQLQALALTDALTGLPNRHWVNQHLPELIRENPEGKYFATLFIDLDNFKSINDSFGHQAGDDYLKDIGEALRASVRQHDHVARLGGDEFMVLLTDLPSPAVAGDVATGLLSGMREISVGDGAIVRARASIGIAIYPDDASNAQALVQAADIAMYEAKHAGKDRWVRYTEEMHAGLNDKLSLQAALEQAVPGNQLLLYLQPRVNTLTGRLAGFEALLRWQHPELGLVSPERFIPLAEESSLIVDVGNWVAARTCELLATWRGEGRMLYPISINVSARQLKSSEFREALNTKMRSLGIQSSQIAIELTESTMVGEDKTIQQELRMLEGMGMKLMIDDFGTGYSSLAQLQRLKVDVLKIDQTFVHNLGTGGQGIALCEAMVQIGRTLGIAVVAEGVETPEQLKLLQAMGCDEVQGFLISRPIPSEQAVDFLTRGQFLEPASALMLSSSVKAVA